MSTTNPATPRPSLEVVALIAVRLALFFSRSLSLSRALSLSLFRLLFSRVGVGAEGSSLTINK
jgi:hypothetical protein